MHKLLQSIRLLLSAAILCNLSPVPAFAGISPVPGYENSRFAFAVEAFSPRLITNHFSRPWISLGSLVRRLGPQPVRTSLVRKYRHDPPPRETQTVQFTIHGEMTQNSEPYAEVIKEIVGSAMADTTFDRLDGVAEQTRQIRLQLNNVGSRAAHTSFGGATIFARIDFDWQLVIDAHHPVPGAVEAASLVLCEELLHIADELRPPEIDPLREESKAVQIEQHIAKEVLKIFLRMPLEKRLKIINYFTDHELFDPQEEFGYSITILKRASDEYETAKLTTADDKAAADQAIEAVRETLYAYIPKAMTGASPQKNQQASEEKISENDESRWSFDWSTWAKVPRTIWGAIVQGPADAIHESFMAFYRPIDPALKAIYFTFFAVFLLLGAAGFIPLELGWKLLPKLPPPALTRRQPPTKAPVVAPKVAVRAPVRPVVVPLPVPPVVAPQTSTPLEFEIVPIDSLGRYANDVFKARDLDEGSRSDRDFDHWYSFSQDVLIVHSEDYLAVAKELTRRIEAAKQDPEKSQYPWNEFEVSVNPEMNPYELASKIQMYNQDKLAFNNIPGESKIIILKLFDKRRQKAVMDPLPGESKLAVPESGKKHLPSSLTDRSA